MSEAREEAESNPSFFLMSSSAIPPSPDDAGIQSFRESPPAPIVSELALNRRFSQHWEQAHLPVRAFLNGFLSPRSAVDDCVQEVALLAWKKGPVEEDPERFKAFCLSCARRIAMAEVRKKYRLRDRHMDVETLASIAEAAAQAHPVGQEDPERLSALRSCLGQLEPGARRLITLRYADSDPTALKKEAAKGGLSVDAIYKKLERLRTLLKRCVAKKMSETEG